LPLQLPAAPLPLAWNAVIVAIHLHAGAIPQEERGFSTGSHLRAVGPPIAFEFTWDYRFLLHRRRRL